MVREKHDNRFAFFRKAPAAIIATLWHFFYVLELIKRGDVPIVLFFDREAVNLPLSKYVVYIVCARWADGKFWCLAKKSVAGF